MKHFRKLHYCILTATLLCYALLVTILLFCIPPVHKAPADTDLLFPCG